MIGRTSGILLAVVLLGSAACEDTLFTEADRTYGGPALMEFAPVLPEGVYVRRVTFAAGSTGMMTVSARVQYVAEPPGSDVTGEVALVSGTTAVEGTDFVLPGGTGYTIPAGQNAADIPVELHAGALEDGESVSIVLELQDGSGFTVSPNYGSFEIRVTKAAP